MTAPLRVGILGAGMMAQGFDRPGSARVLSMAHAFNRSGVFTLGGFFDLQQERAEAAERTWGVVPSPRHRLEWLDADWDIVYIATPDRGPMLAARCDAERLIEHPGVSRWLRPPGGVRGVVRAS